MPALTPAERQARRRDRMARADRDRGAWATRLDYRLEALTRAVEGLATEVHALGTGGGQVRQNGGKVPEFVTSRRENVTSRERARAGARVENATPTPYGGRGVASTRESHVTEDAHLVLVSLVRPGSVGAIRDALSAVGVLLSLTRITAALVYLQGEGQVHRTPGDGVDPDVWEVLEDPALVDLQDARPHHPGPDALATAHVACTDYQAHGLAHAWDPALGAFRCSLCAPDAAPTHAPPAGTPPAGEASPGGPNGAHP